MKNNKLIFWLLSLTWGLPMTLVGAAAALFLYWRGYIPTRFGPSWVFVVGRRWGGISLGPIVLISKGTSESVIHHEIGHAIQNCLWGPLFPFVIAIPSVIRYWLRERETYRDKTKFTLIFDFILMALSVAELFICFSSITFSAWIYLLPSAVIIYLIVITNWLTTELRKYLTLPYPSYNDIWFEGQATRWGIKFMDKEEKE